MDSQADENATEIVFTGQAADTIIERLNFIPELIEGMDEIDPQFLSPEDQVRYVTFFQVVSFGESGRHDRLYGSRYLRNLHLAETNRQIIGLSETVYSQTLVLEGFRGSKEVELGFFDGATVIYPLNVFGASLYAQNVLPPHAFVREHLVSGEMNEAASATFIGGAIHLPSIRDLMAAAEYGGRAGFEPFMEPPGICRAIGERVVNFSPDVVLAYVGELPSLLPKRGNLLPIVVSAISGRGHGEQTLMRLGFVRDGRSIDNASKDRRWIFDLNDLRRSDLPIERRLHMLNSWRWFLQHWKKDSQLSSEIEASIQTVVEDS